MAVAIRVIETRGFGPGVALPALLVRPSAVSPKSLVSRVSGSRRCWVWESSGRLRAEIDNSGSCIAFLEVSASFRLAVCSFLTAPGVDVGLLILGVALGGLLAVFSLGAVVYCVENQGYRFL
jgi:hypothetical protein